MAKPEGPVGAGAPEKYSDDVTAVRGTNALALLLRLSPPIPLGSAVGRTVAVPVAGRVLQVPEHALSEPLAVLSLATEGYVRLEDYAEAVGATLAALAKLGILEFPSSSDPTKDPEFQRQPPALSL